MNAYRLSLIIISVAETHIGHRSTQHTCSQKATWNRHTNEQQVVFLAGIITENQRQQSEIPGRLILFSTNKTFYPLHSTWPCFFSSNASWLQDEQHFSVISCICGFDWSERIRQGERKKKLLVRRSLPTKKKKSLGIAKQNSLCSTCFVRLLLLHPSSVIVTKSASVLTTESSTINREQNYLTVCVY